MESKDIINRHRRRNIRRAVQVLAGFAALYLSVWMLMLPALTLEAGNEEGIVLYTDVAVKAGTETIVSMNQNEHLRLNGSAYVLEDQAWQIYSPDNGQWYSFYEDNASSCDIYYAKVMNFMDASGKVRIRQKAESSGVVNVHVNAWTSSQTNARVRYLADEPEEETIEQTETNKEESSDEPAAISDESEAKQYIITVNYWLQGEVRTVQLSVDQGTDTIGLEQMSAPYKTRLVGTESPISDIFVSGGVQNDMTFDVEYVVPYTVNYLLQKTASSDYDLQKSEVKYAAADSDAQPSSLTFEGFAQEKSNVRHLVSVQGDTVVNVYYSRQFYKLNLILNGGQGSELYSVQYGVKLNVANPVRPGYTFAGWYTDEGLSQEAVIPATMSSGDLTYYAKWNESTSKYTIFVHMIGTDGTSESMLKTIPGNMAKTGAEIGFQDVKDVVLNNLKTTDSAGLKANEVQYYDFDASKTSAITVAADGLSNIHVYLKPKTYTLRFYYSTWDFDYDTFEYIYKVPLDAHTNSSALTNWAENKSQESDLSLLTELASSDWWIVASDIPITSSDTYTKTAYSADKTVKLTESFDFLDDGTFILALDVTAPYGADLEDYLPYCSFDGDVTISAGGSTETVNVASADSAFVAFRAKGTGATYLPVFWVPRGTSHFQSSLSSYYISSAYSQMDERLLGDDPVEADEGAALSFLAEWMPAVETENWKFEVYAQTTQNAACTTECKERAYNGVVYEYDAEHSYTYSLKKDGADEAAGTQAWNVPAPNFVGYTGNTDNVSANVGREVDVANKTVYFYYKRDIKRIGFYNNSSTTIFVQVPYGKTLDDYLADEVTIKHGNDESDQTYSTETIDLVQAFGRPLTLQEIGDNVEAIANLETAAESSKTFYPSSYPSNGYTQSADWYEIESEDKINTEAVFSWPSTMPNHNILLMCDWIPKQMTVTFVDRIQDAYGNVSYVTLHDSVSVTYGTAIDDEEVLSFVPQANGQVFKNWYMVRYRQTDDGEETNVDTVSDLNGYKFYEDTQLIASWDTVRSPYVVHYMEDGTINKVAGSTYDMAEEGTSVLLEAKTSAYMFSLNQTEWFPLQASQVLHVPLDNTNALSATFWYKQAEKVKYRVEYVPVATDVYGNILKNADGSYKTVENDDGSVKLLGSYEADSNVSLVEVSYKHFDGYHVLDDAYHISKTLVWAQADTVAAENTITFYYVESASSVEYDVEYYVQDAQGSYSLDAVEKREGHAGETVSLDVSNNLKSYAGLRFDASAKGAKLSGTVSDDLVLRVYYSRMKVNVSVSWEDEADPSHTVTLSAYSVSAQKKGTLDQFYVLEGTDMAVFYLCYPESGGTVVIEQSLPEGTTAETQYFTDGIDSASDFFVQGNARAGGLVSGSSSVLIKNYEKVLLPSTGWSPLNFLLKTR